VFFRSLQPVPDKLDVTLRRTDPLRGLLLKGVEHIDHTSELHGIDGAIGVPSVIHDDLKHTRASESLQGLGIHMLAASLRAPQGKADSPLHAFRELSKIIQR
jgi:hypothetical protein